MGEETARSGQFKCRFAEEKPLKDRTAAQAPPCLPCFMGCSAAWSEYQKDSGGGSIAAV
jgi:hypothetical protein